MTATLQGAELDCILILAKLYAENKMQVVVNGNWESIGLSEANCHPVLTMLAMYRMISEYSHRTPKTASFTIEPTVVQAARVHEKNLKAKADGKDIVEIVKLTLRKHPLTAWAFIVFVSFTAILTAINQLIGFLKNIRVID